MPALVCLQTSSFTSYTIVLVFTIPRGTWSPRSKDQTQLIRRITGPMQAQANFYYRFCPERYAFPTQRFFGETERLFGVLDARLSQRDYIAGPGRGRYSIADIACWPFVNSCFVTGIDLQKFPNVFTWWERIDERPAVKSGMRVPSGQEFPYGYRVVTKWAKDDPQGVEESEGPLKEALTRAQRDYNYVYQSP